jgi:hypothetical protein
MNDDAARESLGNLEDLLPPRVTEYRAGSLRKTLGLLEPGQLDCAGLVTEPPVAEPPVAEPPTVPIILPRATGSSPN